MHSKHFIRISKVFSSRHFYVRKCKGAIEVVTRILAVELGKRKIRVNTVAPGAIGTDFNDGSVSDNEKINQMVANIIALGRAGVPDDIGGVITFLCTEDTHWVNGQWIEVSGDMH